jgi:excisionase family DNA binding protein
MFDPTLIKLSGGIVPPFLSLEKFAELVGFSRDTVEFWVRTGRLPSKKIGKRRVVDYLALAGVATPGGCRVAAVPGAAAPHPTDNVGVHSQKRTKPVHSV